MASPVADPLTAGSAESIRCRYCHGARGEVVLDLGRQPGCEQFAEPGDDGPDPRYPLRMWLCASCGLAQLAEDPGLPETVLGLEPRSMRQQAEHVLDRLAAEGLMRAGQTVAEFGSPHGSAWLPRLRHRGLVPEAGRADLVFDVYGLLHEPNQSDALLSRAARLAPGGLLVFQMFSLGSVVRLGQWDELRHGHHGYWSLPALDEALGHYGLGVHRAWSTPLAGGTLVALANRTPDPDRDTRALIEAERGAVSAGEVRALQKRADTEAARLREWLVDRKRARRRVIGYGAASRAVPLLCHAGIDDDLLLAVADASPGKQRRRMPGTRIPVIAPDYLRQGQPADVLLLLPHLLDEVRHSVPEVEERGGRWVRVDDVLAGRA